jgi:hypothetical protein
MTNDGHSNSDANPDGTLTQEIRKGGVGHNPLVQGGIVVATSEGILAIQTITDPRATTSVEPAPVAPAPSQHQTESSQQ